jgi:3-methylcrotonyl-CoA carboxylase alpha subunit
MQTILIANRGEIAARVIATARRMGLRTVAVHSDADAEAVHVRAADVAVRIGPAPAAESYLDVGAILAAARMTGAHLIHPGYGFLSENAAFAQAVAEAGMIFVGPPPDAIRAMGLKHAAKARMEAAGVPVVPGHHGADPTPEVLAREAARIGYPVLIKACAGGGGKGMRRVDDPAGFTEALEGAQREGQASFGDPSVLVEKYISTPRHVEVQVLADAHGRVVHLFERDCSLQRRHQKVIEEAPAPGMTDAVRRAMGDAAVEAARAIGYVGAGTVEFIADGSDGLRPDGFWFMEMNTRLQVEHPVTEAITGIDLVEWQIRVALGAPLPFAQDDLRIDGHAIEARIYAEDASADFLPAPGRIAALHWPEAARFEPGALRLDAGVAAGDTVTPHYDPMIAKLIAHGPDRATALARLRRGLDSCRIAGTVTNLPFLSALLSDDAVARGVVDTGLIARRAEDLCAEPDPPPEVVALAVLAAAGLLKEEGAEHMALRGFRAWGPARCFSDMSFGGRSVVAEVTLLGGTRHAVVAGGPPLEFDVPHGAAADGYVTLSVGGQAHRLHLHRALGRITVFAGNRPFVFDLPDPLEARGAAEAAGDAVIAPMPGLVRAMPVAAGDRVRSGEPLAVLEAMKMEHTLTAPRDGIIAAIWAQPGDTVAQGAVLVALEPADVP